MADSILDTTKQVLGLDSDYTAFDIDVLMHINTVFSTLTQLGVGPSDGFEVPDKTTDWATYINGDKRLNSVKTYMYQKTKLMFDPPATSFAIAALQDQINELEWRLMVTVDPIPEGD